MLTGLFITKSRIRRDILSLFFTNPTQKYYLRQLQRLFGYSAGSIRRELLKFQQDNLFETKKEGNLLYYALNIKHPLFNELKSIVAKTVGVEGALRHLLNELEEVSFAFIYGSFASGKESPSSDIDLMIVGDVDTPLLYEKIAALERKLHRDINPTTYSFPEYRAKKRQKTGFIQDLLSNPKIMLIGKEDAL